MALLAFTAIGLFYKLYKLKYFGNKKWDSGSNEKKCGM